MAGIIKNKSYLLIFSISAALVTMALKFIGYLITGSVGMFSDAAESIVNLVASIIALLALAVASRPPDSSHTYGHEKAEYFSSGAEGVLIVVAAIGIFYSATSRMLQPQPLVHLDMGLVFIAAAAAVNLLIAVLLLRAAKLFDSITLEADARHLLTDVITSGGVIAGLLIVKLTGWNILDPILAYLIGMHILKTGFSLVKRSVQGLMDYRLPKQEIETIKNVLNTFREKLVAYHNLRTRKAGPKRFIEFHLLVPGKMSVQEAHDLCEEIEEKIHARLNQCEINIHIEPSEDYVSWDVREGAPGQIFGSEKWLPQKGGKVRGSGYKN